MNGSVRTEGGTERERKKVERGRRLKERREGRGGRAREKRKRAAVSFESVKMRGLHLL